MLRPRSPTEQRKHIANATRWRFRVGPTWTVWSMLAAGRLAAARETIESLPPRRDRRERAEVNMVRIRPCWRRWPCEPVTERYCSNGQ